MPEKHRIVYFQQKYSGVLTPLLLENFPRRQDIAAQTYDLFRDRFPIQKEQKIILYSGTVGSGRYVEELIESMALCSAEYVLVILGQTYHGYEAVLQKKIDRAGVAGRVFLHEVVPYTEILRYMASCDIGTAFYRNTNLNNYYCASNKLYEYIALEKAVVTNNYPGLLAAVEQYQQGVCLAQVTPTDLAAAYRRATDPALVTPGAQKFFWEDEEEVLLQLYGAA
jgi:glycosyltransferase involved in cell wall biosynthesis